jgi:hypothetical protein
MIFCFSIEAFKLKVQKYPEIKNYLMRRTRPESICDPLIFTFSWNLHGLSSKLALILVNLPNDGPVSSKIFSTRFEFLKLNPNEHFLDSRQWMDQLYGSDGIPKPLVATSDFLGCFPVHPVEHF